MAWFGVEMHQSILENLRMVYRIPIIEISLVSLFLFQAVSGIILFFKLRKKEGETPTEKLKMYSGLVLGLFIIQHVPATIGQRLLYEFDTNFYFGANVVNQSPLLYYFVPYYFLGIMSFATHIAAIHREKMIAMIGDKKSKIHFYIILGIFFLLAIVILYVFMEGRFEINIPDQYNVY